jgi:deazaflavin-dependent oxidoreductase (nitroreductase family)
VAGAIWPEIDAVGRSRVYDHVRGEECVGMIAVEDGVVVPCETPVTDDEERETMPLEGEYEASPTQWVREQVELYERSGGTEGTTLMDAGMPVVLLTTRGARSGKIRRTPLMRVEHDGVYAVIASMGGAPKHPVWYYNVNADPQVDLQDGPVRQDMVAREVTGEEKSVWWERAVAAYPPYAEYQEKTDREIPVFVLEPADGN